MVQLLEGVTPYREEDVEKYLRLRWWAGLTLGELLDRAADIHPDKEAFVDRNSRFTYSEVREKADRLAAGLMHLGITPPGPGDDSTPQLERVCPLPILPARRSAPSRYS